MKTKKDDHLIYLGIVVILVAILSFRVVSQGQTMSRSIERVREDGLEIENPETESREKDDQISFDQEFTTPDGKLSFNYSSDWQEIENEEILNLFHSSGNEEIEQHIQDDIVSEEFFEDYEIDSENDGDEEIIGDILFLGMKTTFPNLSFGVMSVQKLNEEIEDIENLEAILRDEFEFKRGDDKAEIINSEKGSDFIIMDVVTSSKDRAVFRAKNVGFLTEDNVYVISLNTPYENWSNLRNEFNMIISSTEFNE